MPINAGHEFFEAEKKYLSADSPEEKIFWLEEMIRKAPKHKGSENLLAELKTRLKKFKAQQEKSKKSGRGKKGIRKEGYQVLLIGKTNSGKSCLLKAMTNANPKIAEHLFTTKEPEIGTMEYEGVKAQMIDMPAVGYEGFDFGLLHGADLLLLVVEDLEDLEDLKKYEERNRGDRIVVVNKIDKLNDNEKRKLDAKCRAKRLKDYILVSCQENKGIDKLKEMVFDKMDVIRVYTKEPGKTSTKLPIVMESGATVKDVAEKILKGFSRQIKEIRLTGPSGKFANQKVGLSHKLKDKDIVEFHTR
ncbi:hypothetical protein AUJ63_02840 [Candidatus Pacearchaeota archaeon CG1_02_35_32]|nr:MAG: hypothetical protein AUJ63_02840 [Candidatus Pacearchaeota archaeon CG1_02_35_32]